MRNFFKKLWQIITAPFRFTWTIITAPFKGWKNAKAFLNEEPEERSLIDTTASTIQSADARASLFDHIEVLRKHLFRALLSLILTVSISFAFSQFLIDYLATPVGGIEKLGEINPIDSIGAFMNVSLISGIIIALPYIAFEFWFFLAPGLKPSAKKFGLLGIPAATFLFIAGVLFAVQILLPPALGFLATFMKTEKNWTVVYYISFVSKIIFGIGIAFEFPLVIYILSSIGLVKPETLKKQWRLAVVIIAVIAAAITPTVDPVNMGLVMLPMTLLYFISIGLSYIAYNGREKNNKVATQD